MKHKSIPTCKTELKLTLSIFTLRLLSSLMNFRTINKNRCFYLLIPLFLFYMYCFSLEFIFCMYFFPQSFYLRVFFCFSFVCIVITLRVQFPLFFSVVSSFTFPTLWLTWYLPIFGFLSATLFALLPKIELLCIMKTLYFGL